MISPHEVPTYRAYIQTALRHPLLSPEEEKELATLANQGDKKAREKLIASNLRLVVSLAKKYLHRRIDGLEIIQEGNLGLIHAVEMFDPTRGVRLNTYAGWWIKAYIVNYLHMNCRPVRIPRARHSRAVRDEIRKSFALGQEVGTPEELAQKVGVQKRSVNLLRHSSLVDTSLQEHVELAGNNSLGTPTEKQDRLVDPGMSPEMLAAEREVATMLEAFSSTLKPREAVILSEYLLAPPKEGVTLQAIGDRYGVSRERIRQVSEQIRTALEERVYRQLED